PEAVAKGFTPFEFAVSLFKQYDDLNMVVFNQPVGMIRYNADAGDFDYDTDYTKSIQSQLQSAVDEVEKKQKLEAEQAKAQAKAEADRRRQEAAQAAAAAKAKAEAEKQAAAEQKAKADAERKAIAEAEKRKAEEARAAAQAAKAEKAREEEAAKQAAAPRAAKPEPRIEAAPKPVPVAPTPRRNTLAIQPASGQDERRTIAPVVDEEPSRMVIARPVLQLEEPPVEEAHAPVVQRTEDLLVEASKITTRVRIEVDGRTIEYRRVYHKWGGVFYFKDGQPCTQLIYEQEAFPPDQLAGASPRSKLD
ncbi:MAG: hypothetical protein ACK4L7_06520, partial [Flavobacteriales bacterium]